MSAATDCLLIGFNEGNFQDYVDLVKASGGKSGAFRDLRLAYVDYHGRPHRALDLLNTLRRETDPRLRADLSNVDFIAPALLILGSRLNAAGLTFDYVNLFQQERGRLVDKLRARPCLSVAITTTLYIHADPVREIVALIREIAPDAVVIVGGPYVLNLADAQGAGELEDILNYLGADVYIIAREGETTLAALVAQLRDGSPLSEVPNLAVKTATGFTITERTEEDNDLAAKIDYELFGLGSGRANELISTRTAKSCPFHCSFCGFPTRAGRYTYLPVPEVERRLDEIATAGHVSTVTFIDDTFNVPRRRFESILRMMISKQYPFRWNCFYRSDHGNEETIALMKEAGCEGVFLGIESGSDAMLERMEKTARRRHYVSALRSFRDVDISTYASLIIGFPGETSETIDATVSLIETERPEYFRAQLWYCDRTTPIWQSRNEYDLTGEAFNWQHSTMNSAEAADLVEEIFHTVRNSTWLPQWGFEQWSTFYLQRLGMGRSNVRHFVELFNRIVAEQITGACEDAARSPLLAEIRKLSLFDAEDQT